MICPNWPMPAGLGVLNKTSQGLRAALMYEAVGRAEPKDWSQAFLNRSLEAEAAAGP